MWFKNGFGIVLGCFLVVSLATAEEDYVLEDGGIGMTRQEQPAARNLAVLSHPLLEMS